MLRQLDLAYQIWDEVLLITTPEEAENRLTIGVYPVGDLIAPGDRPPWVASGADILLELITAHVEPTTWDIARGPGSISRVDTENLDVLVISQRRDVHEQVVAYLARLRRLVEQARSDPASDPIERLKRFFDGVPLHQPPPAALAKEVSFDFHRTPLVRVAEFITERCGIRCRLDERALEDAGLTPETKVTLHVSGITLRSALELLLDQVDLTWVVQDGTLLITTPEAVEQRVTFDIYSVGDLVTFRDQRGNLWEDYDYLVEAITYNVSPYRWDNLDKDKPRLAAGTFAGQKILMVWQTDRAHEEIVQLLRELRNLAAQAPEGERPPRRDRYDYGGYYGRMGEGFF
jgi:hypothetical protein